jgi:hypothetical protein
LNAKPKEGTMRKFLNLTVVMLMSASLVAPIFMDGSGPKGPNRSREKEQRVSSVDCRFVMPRVHIGNVNDVHVIPITLCVVSSTYRGKILIA